MRKNLGLCIADWICLKVSVTLAMIVTFMSRIFKRMRRFGRDKKNVFVYANDLLGDTIVKLPFFFSLRKEFPPEQYHIAVVLSPAIAEVIKKLNLFDEIILEPPLHWRHPIFWLVGKAGVAKSLRWAFSNTVEIMVVCHRSRSLGCDFALMLSSPSISVAYAADIKTPMLPMTARYQAKTCDRMYDHLLEPIDGRHQMEDMDRLLSLAVGHTVVSIRPSEEDIIAMLDFSLVEPNLEYVVLVPGARVGYRRWPIPKFIETAKKLQSSIVVVGTAEESDLAREIGRALECKVIDICGKTTLSQLGGVLTRAKLVITNETGTATYSAMLGAKTVCILGGGDFGAFFPNQYCKNSVSVFHMDDCFNCGWNCTKAILGQSNAAPCIEAITVEDVLDSAFKITQ